jgi:hypothetical protein
MLVVMVTNSGSSKFSNKDIRKTLIIIAIALFCYGLLFSGYTLFFGTLGRIDCGNDCTPDVPTSATSGNQAAEIFGGATIVSGALVTVALVIFKEKK